MKKTLIGLIVIMLVLSLFMTSALAAKPADKPGKDTKSEEREDKKEEQEDKKAEQEAEKEARAAFKEAASPLLSTMHTNREEWGALGEPQEGLSSGIKAKISAIEANGYVLDEAALATIQDNCAEIKDLQSQVRGLKSEIQTLWKAYINAKKESDVDAGTAALNSLIAKQGTRLELRRQIIAALGAVNAALDTAAVPAEDGVDGGDGDDSDDGDSDDDDDDEAEEE